MARNPLEVNHIYQMDAVEGLRRLAGESVDLVITDPPYNIASKDKRTMQGSAIVSTMEAWGAWDRYHPFDYDLLLMSVISECYRALKEGGALYLFTADHQNGYFIRKAVARGFTYRNQLVLAKKNPLPSLSKRNWRRAFELCMYLTKGKPRTFNFLSQQECINLFSCASRSKLTRHPTEKPFAMVRRLIEVSSNPGDLVVDPFVGSGTTAVAAKELGRRYLGFDTNPEYVRLARSRLSETPSLRACSRQARLGQL